MTTEPAKIFLPLTVIGGVAAVVYAVMTGDHAGVSFFLAVAIAGLAAAVSVTTSRDNELAPAVEPEAAAPEYRPLPPVRLPGGPGWPALAALGAGFVMVALVLGPIWAVPGGTLVLFAGAGWLASVSGDRTGRVPDLMPLGIPVVGLFVIGALMFFMSRILLAVSEQASTWIALAVAVLILGAASLVAVKPRISPRALTLGLIAGGMLMVAGGIVGAVAGQRHIEEHHAGAEPVEVEAINIQFQPTEFSLHADTDTVIDFDNRDEVPHNISIYRSPDFSGLAIFQGAVITGTTIEYRFHAPPPGTYYFRCDIHPLMQGRVNVA